MLRTDQFRAVTRNQIYSYRPERESKLSSWKHRYEADKQQSEHTLAEYKDILARMDESHNVQTMDLKNQLLEVCI